MQGKMAQGRAVALGAATGEAVYVFLAFWGFSHFAPNSPRLLTLSGLFAAIILAGLGVYFFRSRKLRQPADSTRRDPTRAVRAFFIGVGISGMNVSLFATWAALIGTLYSMKLLEFSTPNAALFASGVAIGIFLWFSLLLELIKKYRDRLGGPVLDRFLKVFGTVLVALSLVMAYRLLWLWK